MTHGKDVQQRYQTSGGIPWYAVLGPDGKVLFTSDIAPGKNIGFPTEPGEIDHVVTMLTDAHSRITPGQIASVRDAFVDAAAKVNQEMHH